MNLEHRKSPGVVDRRRGTVLRIISGFSALVGTALAAFGAERCTTTVDHDAELVTLVHSVVADEQEMWGVARPDYDAARLVMYRGSTRTACGRGRAISGPFYCPKDHTVYLDLSYLWRIDGDLARAYVIAHELGHHAEYEICGGPCAYQPQLGGAETVSHPTSEVLRELAADCFAGVWMRYADMRGRLAPGEVLQAINLAADAGDDRTQPGATEGWTHGTAVQRANAVRAGFEAGMSACIVLPTPPEERRGR